MYKEGRALISLGVQIQLPEESVIKGFWKNLCYETKGRLVSTWSVCRWHRPARSLYTPTCPSTATFWSRTWVGAKKTFVLTGNKWQVLRHYQELYVRVDLLIRSIIDAFEKACPLVRKRSMGHGPQWTRQLEFKKRQVRQLFGKTNRSGWRRTDLPTEYPSGSTGQK